MRLEELSPCEGAKKKKKRIGRGFGSGHGKTSTKGHKGQKSRSGGVKGAGFEGGQMPLQRRLPKRGFTNIFRKEYAIVNLGDIAKIAAGDTITPEVLIQNGLVRDIKDGIKVLGMGEVKKGFVVRAHKFSKSAMDKLSAAGGRAEVI